MKIHSYTRFDYNMKIYLGTVSWCEVHLQLEPAKDIILDTNTTMNQQMDVCVQRTCHKIN